MGAMEGRDAGRTGDGATINPNPHNEILTPADKAALGAKIGADVGNPHNEILTPTDKAALDRIIRDSGYTGEIDADVAKIQESAARIRKMLDEQTPSEKFKEAPPLTGEHRSIIRFAPDGRATIIRNPTDVREGDVNINAEVGESTGRRMPYSSESGLPPARGEAWNTEQDVQLRGEAWNSGKSIQEK